jgi:inner membrane transporter RhtA
MTCVQVAGALTVDVLDEAGAAGSAWLRLAWGALLLVVIVRPRVGAIAPEHRRTAAALGAVTALMTVAYVGAIERLPLGTTAALQFVGPLGVAVATGPGGRAGLVLPVIAGAGVLALTEPWAGDVDAVGVLLALLAGAGWAAYIVLTQRIGRMLTGLTALALSFPVAALVAAPFGLLDVGRFDVDVVLRIAGIALLMPVVALALELLALRRLPTSTFGILMCLEPAIGALLGFAILDQELSLLAATGIALVIAAGIATQRRPAALAPRAA